MWQTSAGGYVDASVGMIESPSSGVAYATGRYSQNGWFGEGWVFGGTSLTITGLSAGYEYTFANNATLGASIGTWNVSGGPTVGVARVAFDIPFGGANTPGDIDSRLFRNYNFTSLNFLP